jgi:hypothetical protein
MRICDYPETEIKVGMRIRSLADPTKIGTITRIDVQDDRYAWIEWPHRPGRPSGFYGNDCQCEVVED